MLRASICRSAVGSVLHRSRAVGSFPGVVQTGRHFSTVQESTIHLTFVDQDGNRASVPAIVGQTLLEAAEDAKVDIEGPCGGGGAPLDIRHTKDWMETVYGEGPGCFYCHVQIPARFNDILPEKFEDEEKGLQSTWDTEASSQSRLACMIKLDMRHDGMVVLVPDAPPTNII